MSEAVVALRDVFCVHRTNEGDAAALQGTNLELGAGELLCVLGPSGAGKSTLLRVVAGIQLPSAGIVNVLGCDIGRLPARKRARLRHQQMGFLGQHAHGALTPDLSARGCVAIGLALRGMSKRARRARVEQLLDAALLRDQADALPGELSGGERQRLALCASLAHRPSLLLADEPTGELDDASAAAVRTLIVELTRGAGTSVMIASHDGETAAIADRTVRIRDGRIVEDRRGRENALIVGRGGWLRLPSELLTESGIGQRAHARSAPGGLLITPALIGAAPDHEPSSLQGPSTPMRRCRPAEVELRSLTRAYGRGHAQRTVLDELTLAFTPGRMTVIRGRSGEGKTTLLRLVAGLDRPDRGEITIDRHQLGRYDREQLAGLRRERIGYLPQEPSPVGFLSAEENVVLALRMRGWEIDEAVAWAAVVLARVGLADRASQRVERLSAGEAQRVALARALAGARGLLIVDEPTSRLDEARAAEIAELLAAAAAEGGQTVICATHDPVLTRRADEVVALGALSAIGSPGPLRSG